MQELGDFDLVTKHMAARSIMYEAHLYIFAEEMSSKYSNINWYICVDLLDGHGFTCENVFVREHVHDYICPLIRLQHNMQISGMKMIP